MGFSPQCIAQQTLVQFAANDPFPPFLPIHALRSIGQNGLKPAISCAVPPMSALSEPTGRTDLMGDPNTPPARITVCGWDKGRPETAAYACEGCERPISREKLDFIAEHDVEITISHDGPGQHLRGPDPFDDPDKSHWIQTLLAEVPPPLIESALQEERKR